MGKGKGKTTAIDMQDTAQPSQVRPHPSSLLSPYLSPGTLPRNVIKGLPKSPLEITLQSLSKMTVQMEGAVMNSWE